MYDLNSLPNLFDLENPTPLFPFGGSKLRLIIYFNSSTSVILGIITPSAPASRICLQISRFLLGSLTKAALLLFDATLKS